MVLLEQEACVTKINQMKYILVLLFSAITLFSNGQLLRFEDSIAYRMRANIDYDTMAKLDCASIPSGVYSVWYGLAQNRKKLEIVAFSHDSLFVIKGLIGDAIQKTFKTSPVSIFKRKKIYFQNFYFDNFQCVTKSISVDSTSIPEYGSEAYMSYAKSEVIKILNNVILQSEKSVLTSKTYNFSKKRVVFLPSVLVSNYNPNIKKGKSVDGKPSKNITKEEIEEMLKKIQEKKAQKK
jgi:hypothetical protein